MDLKNILKTEYLDIVFNKRNKQYGAYELRKNYYKRMRNAAVIVAIAALIIGFVPSILAGLKPAEKKVKPMVKKVKLKAPPPVNKKKLPPPPPPPPPPPKVKPQVKFTPPKIVKKEEVKEEEKPPPKEKLEKASASTITIKGDTSADLSAPTIKAKEEEHVEGPPPPKEDKKIYLAVEQDARFPGGEDAMMQWLANHISYPKIASENGITGIVYIDFVVNKNGSIEQVKVKRGIGGGCDEEAMNAVKKMPRWQAAENGGVPVRSQFTLPVQFVEPE